MAEEARKPRILLGLTGSVASIKAIELIARLRTLGDLRVVYTKAAAHFIDVHILRLEHESLELFNDDDEWKSWNGRGDPVVHIELRKWADIFVIAPLSANSLAKLANGLSDNLLSCVARAWDFGRPLLVAPAMNTLMWQHPFTSRHLDSLASLGVVIIPPVSKTLVCGDTGVGAMASIDTIAETVQQHLSGSLSPSSATQSAAAATVSQPRRFRNSTEDA
eukprot:TRINITY_DN1899_c0_g1_i1.p1 TRINITY_DN1899_c0_g1~~TRINITY_DN1899_c0_g1_i1.p1  ORF type:complete len:237 (+),score=46.98 TRINITY_DN1899_c0_g1_i1:54-713(+)